MFFEILIAIIIGVTAGIFTGLIPGIHINLIALFLISISPFLLTIIQPLTLIIFIIAMAITHTFLDSIPGIYLGAPDEAMALSVLPGHKLLLKGQGHLAVKLTVIGSLTSLIIAFITAPILIKFFPIIYEAIKTKIGYILIVIMIFMIAKDKKRLLNLTFFLIAGVLGIITLNIPNIGNPLLPLLSGLFGVSLLIISLKDNTKIPIQKEKENNIKIKTILKAASMATIVGSLASFLPGFSSSQSAIIAQTAMKKINDQGFLILVGGINTVNMAMSTLTFYTLQKARNGAIIAIQELTKEINITQLIIILITILITASIATILALKISKLFSKYITKINYKVLILSVITLVTAMVIVFSGLTGLIIYITAIALGIVATNYGIGKNHLMGCLILPVILFFIL